MENSRYFTNKNGDIIVAHVIGYVMDVLSTMFDHRMQQPVHPPSSHNNGGEMRPFINVLMLAFVNPM